MLRLRLRLPRSLEASACRREASLPLYLPLLLIAMLAYSVGRLQPHRALERLEELLGGRLPGPLARLASCYRLQRSLVVDDLAAFSRAMRGVGGEAGSEIARIYVTSYEVLGEKLAVLRELSERALEAFRASLERIVALVRETVKLVAMANTVLVLVVAFAALVSSNLGALMAVILVDLAAAAALPILVKARVVYSYTKPRSTLDAAQEALHTALTLAALLAAARGSVLAAAVASAGAATVSASTYILDRRHNTRYRELRHGLRLVSEARAAGGRGLGGLEPWLRASLEARIPPAEVEKRYGAVGRSVVAAASALLYAGVASALRILEEVVEVLEDARRRIDSISLEVNAALAGVEAAVLASTKLVAEVFAQTAPATPMTPFALGGLNPAMLHAYLSLATLAITATAYSAVFALTGRPSKNLVAPLSALMLALGL